MFSPQTGDVDIQKKHLSDYGDYVVTSGVMNNGIAGFTNIKAKVFDKNTLTVDMFGNVFYRSFKYKMVTHARVFSLTSLGFEINKNTGLYLSVLLRKTLISKFSYGSMCSWEKIKDMSILLPITSFGEIDYAFMEARIQEMEQARIQEMDAYLKVAGFENCELTDEEKSAIEDAKNSRIHYVPYRIKSLMKGETGDVDIQNKDINGKGCFFINSGVTEQGIKGKTDRKAKIFAANTITIDFFGNAYYRSFEYKLATHNHVFSYSGDCIKNEAIGLYLVAKLGYLSKIYSFSNMGTKLIYDEHNIDLPIDLDGCIDYHFMETYIRAQEKLAIQRVKDWRAKEIAITKKVVNVENKTKINENEPK